MVRVPETTQLVSEPRGNFDGLGSVAGSDATTDEVIEPVAISTPARVKRKAYVTLLRPRRSMTTSMFQHVFEPGRIAEVAGGRNPRPTDFAFIVVCDDA